MANYSPRRLRALLTACDEAETPDAAGDSLEHLSIYLIGRLGLQLIDKNILDAPRAHELDVAFWQIQTQSLVGFLDPVVIIECKNTGEPVGSAAVGWFVRKLQDRGANVGLLVALSGITGASDGRSSAHSEVLTALTRDKIRILILSRDEIERLRTPTELAELLKEKYLQLTLRLTVV
jgi:hypothetical protein